MTSGKKRIAKAFGRAARQGRAALVVFVEAGDPDLQATARLLPALEQAGADILELGIPFSDPIADGPTIQRASERALAGGTTLASALDAVRVLRDGGLSAPIVLFSYANPILALGEEELARHAAAAGIDGVLVTDLPPEEGSAFARVLRRSGIDPIFLVAPTSPDVRLARAGALSRGFVYLVSREGITGARTALPDGLPALVARVKERVGTLPVAVGFGISTPEQVAAVASLADGVVVGSAVVAAIEDAARSGGDPAAAAAALVRRLAAATRRE